MARPCECIPALDIVVLSHWLGTLDRVKADVVSLCVPVRADPLFIIYTTALVLCSISSSSSSPLQGQEAPREQEEASTAQEIKNSTLLPSFLGSSPPLSHFRIPGAPVMGTEGAESWRLEVGRGAYEALVTNRREIAVSWVRDLPLRDPSPPVPRIVGFSCSWGFLCDGGPILHSIHVSFFSRVLVLHLSRWHRGIQLPTELKEFLCNPRNMFVGDEVNVASEMLGLAYGNEQQWMPWRLNLSPAVEMSQADGEPPHVSQARRQLGWPAGDLLTGGGSGESSSWPLAGLKIRFAVQSCVLPQLLGHFRMLSPPISVPSNPEWW